MKGGKEKDKEKGMTERQTDRDRDRYYPLAYQLVLNICFSEYCGKTNEQRIK